MIAHAVAAPVLARARELYVTHAGRHAGYADLDGFVVVVAGRGGPLLPNGVVVTGGPRAGTLALDGARAWDPTLPPAAEGRGDDVLRELGAAEGPLAQAVATRDPKLAGAVAAGLIGRGGGLTPEGDDAVAATAAVVAAGPWPAGEKAAFLAALLGERLRERTTALSATLLELAAAGAAAEPLHAVLAGDRWREALPRLTGIGHSTGRVYAVNAATAVRALGYVAPRAGRGEGSDARGAPR
jgi:hypothetical protein